MTIEEFRENQTMDGEKPKVVETQTYEENVGPLFQTRRGWMK